MKTQTIPRKMLLDDEWNSTDFGFGDNVQQNKIQEPLVIPDEIIDFIMGQTSDGEMERVITENLWSLYDETYKDKEDRIND